MTPCERCKDPSGEFFGNDGTSLCKRCFYAEDNARRELQADEALVEELPPPLRVFVKLKPTSANAKPSKPNPPGTQLRRGVCVMLVSVPLTVGAIYLGFGIEIALGLVGLGFMMTVRGYQLRHYV